MDELLHFLGGEDARAHRRVFSRVGWAMAVLLLLQFLVQWTAILLAQTFSPGLLHSAVFIWVLGAVASYGVAFPGAALVLRTLAAPQTEVHPMEARDLPRVYFVCLGAMYLSNFVTLALTTLIGTLRGEALVNPVSALLNSAVWLNLLLGCVLAPVAEELLFRKVLLDRLRPYGEGFAVLASALLFALIHGNLFQLLYAFTVGMCFGYIALRTGQVRWTILLHALVNFVSMGLLPLAAFMGEIGNLLLAGLVIFSMVCCIRWLIRGRSELKWEQPHPVSTGVGERWGFFFVNPGMTVFCAVMALCVWVSLLP